MKEIVASLDKIDEVIDALEKVCEQDVIVFLKGDLASGKTTLVQRFVKRKGLEDSAASPTFSLQHRYADTVFHYDLYRIDEEEFIRLGLIEEFDKSGIHLVEWGSEALERFLKDAGYNVVSVEIEPHKNGRLYRIRHNAHA